ncbi:hypothetical protein AAFF_G00314350 [Aldrovandia affinis]|uniref:Uncharacterized protein n=1 Tax=Aldrovandia affinis TaxID=143900 RepID=A0AAD7R7Y4_9TELE|nr:hypothetical protein AAFF_G00314350 [Aldrovandia affinis]
MMQIVLPLRAIRSSVEVTESLSHGDITPAQPSVAAAGGHACHSPRSGGGTAHFDKGPRQESQRCRPTGGTRRPGPPGGCHSPARPAGPIKSSSRSAMTPPEQEATNHRSLEAPGTDRSNSTVGPERVAALHASPETSPQEQANNGHLSPVGDTQKENIPRGPFPADREPSRRSLEVTALCLSAPGPPPPPPTPRGCRE